MHLGRIVVESAAHVELHVGVLRRLGRIANSRPREDVVDKVLSVIVVSASISEEGEGQEVLGHGLDLSQGIVLSQQLHYADLCGNVGTFQALIQNVEVPKEVLE